MCDSDPLSWMNRKGRCAPAASILSHALTHCLPKWARLGMLLYKACDGICVARAHFRLSLALFSCPCKHARGHVPKCGYAPRCNLRGLGNPKFCFKSEQAVTVSVRLRSLARVLLVVPALVGRHGFERPVATTEPSLACNPEHL